MSANETSLSFEPFYPRRRNSTANNVFSSVNPNSSSLRNLSQDSSNNKNPPQNYPGGRGSNNFFQVDPSQRRRASAQPQRIPWGVSTVQDQYQTSYNSLYYTQDKISSTPQGRTPVLPNHRLSLSLIPVDTHVPRKSLKNGDFNYPQHRKMPSEDSTFFDKIGERDDKPAKRGRLYIPKPDYKEPAINSEYRFYRTNTEPSQKDVSKELYQSKVVKHLLDFHSAQNNIITGGYEKATELKEDVSSSGTQIINKLGPGYSYMLKRGLINKPVGKKLCSTSPKRDDLKSVIAHSYLKKEQTFTIEMTEDEEETKPKPTIPENRGVQIKKAKVEADPKAKQAFNRNYSGRSQTKKSPEKRANIEKLRLNIVTVQNDVLSIENSALVHENQVKVSEKRQPRSAAANSALSKMTNASTTANTAALPRDRSRSNSIQSMTATFSRRDSIPSGRDVSKDKSIGRNKIVSKNTSVIVSHEKKKPLSGSYANPVLKKMSAQKTMNMTTTGTFGAAKRNLVGQKRM